MLLSFSNINGKVFKVNFYNYIMKNEIIKQIYLATIDFFPKRCGCGRVYKSEKEYLKRTEKRGFIGGVNLQYLFLRDCKCRSTIGFAINKQTSEKILKSAEKISKRENCSVEQVMDKVYNLYKDWVRDHEKISTNRVLIYDTLDSQETKGLTIPCTEVVRSTSLEEALNSFQANPEWTRVILLKSSGDYSKENLFVSSVRTHRDYRDNIPVLGMISKTENDNGPPEFDLLIREPLSKDKLKDFLTFYLKNIIKSRPCE